MRVRLKEYNVPNFMYDLIVPGRQSGFLNYKRQVLKYPLNWKKYTEKLQMLLYLEEIWLDKNIEKYDIYNAVFHLEMGLFPVEVLGVSENRPSVRPGDVVYVYPAYEEDEEEDLRCRGTVHSVQHNSVKIKLPRGCLYLFEYGMRVNVEFTVNTLLMRLQHRALEQTYDDPGLESVLFPHPKYCYQQDNELPMPRLFDRKLEHNPEQYQAIQHIMTGSSCPAPYLIYGPPGTGKTVTMAEAIKQIANNSSSSVHILVCASNNQACDVLCEKIVCSHVDKREVYRMYASSHKPRLVPAVLQDCSNLLDGEFVFPDEYELMSYKIIVTTLYTAGRLVTEGIPFGHFTHVFIDEAGHALETECLIVIAGLLDENECQVVLAGDPEQLGPIVRSYKAKQSGMEVSLLERLLNLYSKKNMLRDSFCTQLRFNYRSHPSILHIPNQLFYNGELSAQGKALCYSCCQWKHLPKKGFPLIFHSVSGVEEKEYDSPSIFNIAEKDMIIYYVKKLLQTSENISLQDIGIITPYRKQVQKIKESLEIVGREYRTNIWNTVKVGTVEEFQGDERKVILVSTVRSSNNRKNLNEDKHFNLGVIHDKKKFNVVLTRAVALLIVVGDQKVLKSDYYWRMFIEYCEQNGGTFQTTSNDTSKQ